MIYIFSKNRPSQIREMSDMSPTISRIRDVQEFMTAVSVKERIAACLSVFIKKNNPTGLGRTSQVSNDNLDGYNGKRLSPGIIQYLDHGDDVYTVNPNGQASDATQFVKLQQQLMGAGQGLSYEATTRDMSQTNYSSARQGLIEDNLTYAEDRELIEEIMDEVYETFIISAVLAGKLKIRDFWENKDSYFKHEWIHAPKRWIDPAKEANAIMVGLRSGQRTFQQIAAENGRDWKEQIDDMAAVIRYGEENGIDLKGIIYGQKEEYTAVE